MTAVFGAIGHGLWLLWRSMRGVSLRAWRGDVLLPRALMQAMARLLWRPLPTICALSGLAGLITGMLASRLLELYNIEALVVGSLAETVLRQVLPLVIGVFASGSIAVDLAARLGAMHLANEIEALDGMGHDPAAFVLGPLVVAVLAASPLHMVLASLAALLMASVPLTLTGQLSGSEIARLVAMDGVGAAMATGAAKAALFSIITFMVGITVGARPVRAPAQIGHRASRAFTISLLAVFLTAALWLALE